MTERGWQQGWRLHRSHGHEAVFLLILSLTVSANALTPAEQCGLHYAAIYRVPPELIAAFIDVEPGWNSHAVSNKAAMGLMQLMLSTVRRFGAFQPFDVEQTLRPELAM